MNDFDFNDRSYRVYVQADASFRSRPQDIGRYYVRTPTGQMVRLDSVVKVADATAPQVITHYNLFRSTEINGRAAPGFSSGQAIARMEDLARRALPQGMTYAWSGLSLEEIQSGGQAVAHLRPRPAARVPRRSPDSTKASSCRSSSCCRCRSRCSARSRAQWLRGLINDVYAQIGLVMLIGLSAKNGILIVEFAEQLRRRGLSIADAAVEAARIRLRPILMTSFAFILGVLPLVFATGAGRAARHSVGTSVAGGMFLSTILNLAIIPVLYVIVRSVGSRRTPEDRHE